MIEANEIIKESRFVLNNLLSYIQEQMFHEGEISQDLWDRIQALLGQMDQWAASNNSPRAYRDWHHAAADEIEDS